MWASPPINLPGKPGKKHTHDGNVLCSKCGKSNSVSADAKKEGKVVCRRCGHVIKVS